MGAFHAGEQTLQERVGVRERFAHAAFIRDFMPDQHRDFFAQLPFVLAGSIDGQGQPWASVLAGPPGFVHLPDARTLEVDAWPHAADPLAQALKLGAPLGLLGIQPHTRRRNRANGHVVEAGNEKFSVRVDQSFGNCPKYIQAREPHYTGEAREPPSDSVRMDTLDDAAVALVRRSDTFFIATAHPAANEGARPEHGVDVSHRGGKPGFVRIEGGAVLTVADFTGNSYFNTLGNLLLEPRCGLLFIDVDSGDTLQVAARGTIEMDGEQRSMRLAVTGAIRCAAALPITWGPVDYSPFLP